MLERKCPECTNIITYKSKRGYTDALLNNSSCRKCISKRIKVFGENHPGYGKKQSQETKDKISRAKKGIKPDKTKNYIGSRICSQCSNEIKYKSISGMNNAIKNNSICKSCSSRNKMIGVDYSGENNPNYGRKHTEKDLQKMKGRKCSPEQVEKMRIFNTGRKGRTYTQEQLERHREMCRNRKNRPYMEVWTEKYGEEGARIRHEKYLATFKGRPARNFTNNTKTSGPRGWSGYYKGFLFRSFLELSYVINVLEKNNINWCTGEDKLYKIPYTFKNVERNYYPDFIIENKIVVECKSLYGLKSEQVTAKTIAAEIWCLNHGYEYRILTNKDITYLTRKELVNLFKTGEIQLIKGLEEKFINRYFYKKDLIQLESMTC